MLWQWISVAVLVGLAAGYVGRQSWRTWFGRKSTGCGGSCGCASKEKVTEAAPQTLIPVDQLTARLRQRQ